MRLGRKLSEGFAVDRDADAAAPVPDGPERAVPASAEADATADPAGTTAQPVASGRPPVG